EGCCVAIGDSSVLRLFGRGRPGRVARVRFSGESTQSVMARSVASSAAPGAISTTKCVWAPFGIRSPTPLSGFRFAAIRVHHAGDDGASSPGESGDPSCQIRRLAFKRSIDMTFLKKVEEARRLIDESIQRYPRIVLGCSFGKDSMVTLHLTLS